MTGRVRVLGTLGMAAHWCRSQRCLACIVVPSLLVGCSTDNDAKACLAETAQAIVGGAINPPIPISSAQVLSVGALVNPDGELKCSGLLVDERWVLTAGHCIGRGSDEVLLFRTGTDDQPVAVPTTGNFWHQTLDALLLELPPSAGLTTLGVAKIPFGTPASDPDSLRHPVTLVGFGRTEDAGSGGLRFVSEPIANVDDTFVTVDGRGTTGACAGDSGGPLLQVVNGQTVSVIGLLSDGSASCTGKDRYLRTDLIVDWVAQLQRERAADPCGGLTWEGSCHDGQLPAWCAGDHVDTAVCGPDELCGWSDLDQGFRCVAEALDPCHGAGPLGACENETLLQCDRGILKRTDCSRCGAHCAAAPEEAARCLF